MIGQGRIRTNLDSASKTPILENPAKNGTQDGTPKTENAPLDSDLARLIEVLPHLPAGTLAAMLRVALPHLPANARAVILREAGL